MKHGCSIECERNLNSFRICLSDIRKAFLIYNDTSTIINSSILTDDTRLTLDEIASLPLLINPKPKEYMIMEMEDYEDMMSRNDSGTEGSKERKDE